MLPNLYERYHSLKQLSFSPVGDTLNVCSGVHMSILIFIFPVGYENWDKKIPSVIALYGILKFFIMNGGR